MISIKDMYAVNPHLFDSVEMPEVLAKAKPPIQRGLAKDEWIGALLMEVGRLGTFYCRDDELQEDIGYWAKLNFNKWSRMADTMHYDFDPTYNFDRMEEYQDLDVDSRKSSASGQSSDTQTGKTTTSSESLDMTGVSAYDQTDAAYTPRDKTDSSGSGEATTQTNGNGTSSSNASEEVKRQHDHTAHLYGNIGVTTTTQMLTEAYEFAKLNVFRQMIDDFKTQFCVMVYC